MREVRIEINAKMSTGMEKYPPVKHHFRKIRFCNKSLQRYHDE